MRPSDLPQRFQPLANAVRYVQQVSHREFCSSCPKCGGDLHPSGEWPDRFRIFVDEHPLAWCRRCGYIWYPDMADGYQPPSPEELERWRREQEAREEGRRRSAERALAHLRSQELWRQYHEMLDARARQWWRSQGIPDAFQDWWGLGWEHDTSRWSVQSATIPLFGMDGQVLNIKHRLMDESKGKYRYHVPGLPAPMFLCDHEKPLEDHVIAIEGEKKAMVTYVTMDDPDACVVGLPGLNPSPEVQKQLSQAERVTLVLDPGSDRRGPDGWSPMGRLVHSVGRRKCRVLILPDKIDDVLLAMNANKHECRWLLRQAKVV